MCTDTNSLQVLSQIVADHFLISAVTVISFEFKLESLIAWHSIDAA